MDSNRITLSVDGMTCNNCAMGVQKFLEKQGLEQVDVSFANAEASFRLDDEGRLDDLVGGIEGLGFKVLQDNEPLRNTWFGFEEIVWKLGICVLFTLPLLLSMFLPFPILRNPLVQLLLSLPVMAIGIWHFGISAFNSLRSGIPNMDVLIIIGSVAAFAYSFVGFVLQLGERFLFFETAATIITFVLIGNYLEYRSVKKTTVALSDLAKLRPEKAHLVMHKDGVEHVLEIAQEEIQIGDLLQVHTGDKIPTDGRIVWGEGSLDESMMTGESALIAKVKGDDVIGSTLLSEGTLRIKASNVGDDTVLSQIIRLVKDAQANKPSIQRIGDTVASIFVPIVLLISLGTFLLEYLVLGWSLQASLLNAVAVLVVSCPCAMGLATPTALMVGIGKAAKEGILIKGGDTLETLAKVRHMVFDKTGTLTTGNFRIKKLHSGIDQEVFKGILYSLEMYSSHPLATSIVKELKGTIPYEMSEIKEIKGLGIMGKDLEGNTFMLGSYEAAKSLTDDDSHNIYVMYNHRLIGWVDMEDEIREAAAESVAALEADGVQTLLISGDKKDSTTEIAKKVGIEEYYFGKLPNEKLELIDEKLSEGVTVMVGDGINDAPALSKASVGISLRRANQIAIHSADVVLMSERMDSLNRAVKISKMTLKTIKQNLFWAFFYNVLAIPIAAAGFLNPMIAALAMAFSDVIVIGNSLRLRNKEV